jgi:vacuolar-type H+-ATPase subunit D/Vma8
MLALTQYPSMRIFIPDTRERLTAEMEELIKQQRDALQSRMTDKESEAYDKRQQRIRELFEALNRFRAAA